MREVVLWGCLAMAVAVLAWHSLTLQPWTLDDAFISYRYAENWADGHGPVYNPGEYVEGYTTFLWVALLAVASWFEFPLDPVAKGLAVGFGLGSLVLLFRAHRIVPGLDPWASGLAAVVAGTSGIFTLWVNSGMEVAMTGFWLILAFMLHLRARTPRPQSGVEAGQPTQGLRYGDIVGSSLACACAVMSRPDAALLPLILGLDWLYLSARYRNRGVFIFGGVFVAVYAPYFAWRFWYYGHLLPNTFYAKVGSSSDQLVRGLRYLSNFATPGLPIMALVLAALLGLAGIVRRYAGLHLAAFYLALHTVYVIAVGGDVMPAFRFFSAVLPIGALLGAHAIAPQLQRGPALVWAVALVTLFNATLIQQHRTFTGGNVGRNGEWVGRWLRAQAPPDTLLATNTAGSVPYFSKLRTIDTLGLNDETIAHREIPTMGKGSPGHEKGDGAYVLSLEPDLIQFGSASGNVKPVFLGDREMVRLPAFKKDYVFRRYRLPNGRTVAFYVRKDREDALNLPKPLP